MDIAQGAQFSKGDQFFGLVGKDVQNYTKKPEVKITKGGTEDTITQEKTSYTALQVLGFIINCFLAFIPFAIACIFTNKKITLQTKHETEQRAAELELRTKEFEQRDAEVAQRAAVEAMNYKEAVEELAAEKEIKTLYNEILEIEEEFLEIYEDVDFESEEPQQFQLVQELFMVRRELELAFNKLEAKLSSLTDENPTRAQELEMLFKDEFLELNEIQNGEEYHKTLKDEVRELEFLLRLSAKIADVETGLSAEDLPAER